MANRCFENNAGPCGNEYSLCDLHIELTDLHIVINLNVNYVEYLKLKLNECDELVFFGNDGQTELHTPMKFYTMCKIASYVQFSLYSVLILYTHYQVSAIKNRLHYIYITILVS